MSLTGNAKADKVLRGRINRLDTLCISAYEIAVKHGFEGTEAEWVASLEGYVLTNEDKDEIALQAAEHVTPETLGLGNVDNTSDADKPVSIAQATAIADAKEAGTDAQSTIDAHTEDTNNPHGVTIAQIGAAPAGFGLGGAGTVIEGNAAIDNADANGWYKFLTTTPYEPFDTGCMLALSRDGGTYGTQIAFKDSSGTTYIKIRKKNNGTWGEWEWVNPPMDAGVEYRTIKRHKGRPVYTMLHSIGWIAAGTYIHEIPTSSGYARGISVKVYNNDNEELSKSAGYSVNIGRYGTDGALAVSITLPNALGALEYVVEYTL